MSQLTATEKLAIGDFVKYSNLNQKNPNLNQNIIDQLRKGSDFNEFIPTFGQAANAREFILKELDDNKKIGKKKDFINEAINQYNAKVFFGKLYGGKTRNRTARKKQKNSRRRRTYTRKS